MFEKDTIPPTLITKSLGIKVRCHLQSDAPQHSIQQPSMLEDINQPPINTSNIPTKQQTKQLSIGIKVEKKDRLLSTLV